jgi:hypothetical protein
MQVELPEDAEASTEFAEYKSHYALANQTLIAERMLTIKKPKVGLDQWNEYKKFFKTLREDQTTMLEVSTQAAGATESANASQIRQLQQQAGEAARTRNVENSTAASTRMVQASKDTTNITTR